ncbi:hypothetical protein F4679DRAFT_585058 [Xylaria curta]|nr:hypothetical protein F4679DRAFT_585058 [Xylaria curta]
MLLAVKCVEPVEHKYVPPSWPPLDILVLFKTPVTWIFMTSGLPTSVPPRALESAICFETALGCFEAQNGPSPQNRPETPRPPSRSLCADTSLLWGEGRPLTVSFLGSCTTPSFTDEQVKDFVKDGAHD